MGKASTWLYAAAALLFSVAVAYDLHDALERQATWEKATITDIGKDTEPKSA